MCHPLAVPTAFMKVKQRLLSGIVMESKLIIRSCLHVCHLNTAAAQQASGQSVSDFYSRWGQLGHLTKLHVLASDLVGCDAMIIVFFFPERLSDISKSFSMLRARP